MHRARPCLLLIGLTALLPALGNASEELNIQLKRIFDSKDYEPKMFGPARWIDGGSAYTTLEPSPDRKEAIDIVEYETATGIRKVLIPASALIPPDGGKLLTIEDYTWSNDGTRVLVFTNAKKVWRSNTRGDYWVLDRSSGKLQQLGGSVAASSLMFAKFSPDGKSVAYVRANNLYAESLVTKTIYPLTTDGSETTINGTSDWVYEEELSLRDCFRWSPDSRRIAYWQFDSSGVEKFTLLNNADSLYPKATLIPYPKVGTSNSAVRIGVVNSTGGQTRWMELPGDPRQNYLFRMDWLADSRQLAVGQLNRLQNHLVVFLSDTASGSSNPIFEDKDAAWVDVPKFGGRRDDKFEFVDDDHQLFWLSEREGWRQAYLASLSNTPPRKVTTGEHDVIGVERIDAKDGWLYYLASPENATQAYLYRTTLQQPGEETRLTPAGEPGSHQYDISPDGHWAFHTYSRFEQVPVTDLVSLPDHKRVRMLEDNSALQAAVAPLLNPPAEFFQVRLEDGTSLDASHTALHRPGHGR